MTEETRLIYSRYRCGKAFMLQMQWKYLKCKKCNSELKLTKSNEYEEIKTCPKCGANHALIKKIRGQEKC